MSWAYREAMKEALKTELSLKDDEVRVRPNGQPTNIASTVFIAVHPGSWTQEIKGGRQLHEDYTINVTISVRGTRFPGDRWGLKVLNAVAEDGLEWLSRLVIVHLHGNDDIRTAADNELATLNPGFVHAPYLERASGPDVRPASWWGSDSGNPEEGLSYTITFGKIKRVQEISTSMD